MAVRGEAGGTPSVYREEPQLNSDRRGRVSETRLWCLRFAERKAGAAVPVPKTVCGFYTQQSVG